MNFCHYMIKKTFRCFIKKFFIIYTHLNLKNTSTVLLQNQNNSNKNILLQKPIRDKITEL